MSKNDLSLRHQMDVSCDDGISDAATADERLTSPEKNDIKNHNLQVHCVKADSPKCKVAPKKVESSKFFAAKELKTDTEEPKHFVHKRYSECTNYHFVRDAKMTLCNEDGAKNIDGSSNKPIILDARIKTPSCLTNSGGSCQTESFSNTNEQIEGEVNSKSDDDESFETMRERIASYISYSGSESSSSDSEVFDLNKQVKDSIQTRQVIEKRNLKWPATMKKNEPNLGKHTNSLYDRESERAADNTVASKDLKDENESLILEEIQKFGKKLNVSRVTDHINTLTPVTFGLCSDALINNSDSRSQCPIPHLSEVSLNTLGDTKTHTDKNSDKICSNDGDYRHLFHSQNEATASSINVSDNSCLEDERIASKNDSSDEGSSYCVKRNEDALTLLDNSSKVRNERKNGSLREEYLQDKENSENCIREKVNEVKRVKVLDNKVGEPKHTNQQERSYRIDSASTDKFNRPDSTYFPTDPLKDKSRDRSRSPRSRNSKGRSPCVPDTSVLEWRSSKHEHSVHAEERGSGECSSLIKSQSVDIRDDKNLTGKKYRFDPKNLVCHGIKRQSREPCNDHVIKKQMSEKPTTRQVNANRETGHDGDEMKIIASSRCHSRRSVSPEREHRQMQSHTHSRESTPLERERKHSSKFLKKSSNDDGLNYSPPRRNSRRSISLEKERRCRRSRSRESTPLERERKHSSKFRKDSGNDDELKYSPRRRNSRRSISLEKERRYRRSRSRERTASLERESRYAKARVLKENAGNENESKNSASGCRNSRRSVSLERCRRSRSRESTVSRERESRHAKARDRKENGNERESKNSASRCRNSRRSVYLVKERCRRSKSRESTASLERESRYSKSQVNKESGNDRKSKISDPRRRTIRRSVSLEKDRRRRSRSCESTSSMERESAKTQVHKEYKNEHESKSPASGSRSSRRSVSLEKERRRRRFRENSSSPERESKYAKAEQRRRDSSSRERELRYHRRIRSPVSGRTSMRQEHFSRRRLTLDTPDMSWTNNIVVKIAEPRRGPIRKRKNPGERRFIHRSKVEDSSRSTDDPKLSESSPHENDAVVGPKKRKKRWTYGDYVKENDGSLRRIREYSDDEKQHSGWKRYDDETTMPYQGYADSQVQSLLKQLCGDYVTKLYSKETINEDRTLRPPESQENSKDHRTWFITLSEWISYGIQASSPADRKDSSIACEDSSTKTSSVVWHTVPFLPPTPRKKSVLDFNINYSNNNKQESANNAEVDKCTLVKDGETKAGANVLQLESNKRDEKTKRSQQDNIMEQTSFQQGLLISATRITEQTSSCESKEPIKQNNKTISSNMLKSVEGSETIRNRTSEQQRVGIGVCASGSLAISDVCNISTNSDTFQTGQMLTRNDFLTMVTPSSYWYEKNLLVKEQKKASKVDNTVYSSQSVCTPTSFCPSRPTDVSTTSVCFHFDASRFDFLPHELDSRSSDVEEDKLKIDDQIEDNTTPPNENRFTENESSIDKIAMSQLNCDNFIEKLALKDSKNNGNDKSDIQTIESDQETLKDDRIPPSKNELFVSLSLKAENESANMKSKNKNKLSDPVNDMPSAGQTVNSSASSSGTNSTRGDFQLSEKSFVDQNIKTNRQEEEEEECKSEVKSIPKEKTVNCHLGGENAKVPLEENVNHSSGTHLIQKEKGKTIDCSSMKKVGDSDFKIGEEIWDLALMSTSSEILGDKDTTRSFGPKPYIAKSRTRSGEIDVAVVKPSTRQDRSPLNHDQTSEHFTPQGEDDVVITPSPKALIDKPLQTKIMKRLECPQNSTNFAIRVPSSEPQVSSFAYVKNVLPKCQMPSNKETNSQRTPIEGPHERLLTTPVVSRRAEERFLPQKSVVNLQNVWDESRRGASQGPPLTHFSAPQTHQQVKYDCTFQTPNPRPNECYAVKSLVSNQMVVQHFLINSDLEHSGPNTPLNAKVMAPLPNQLEILPAQQEGNSKSFSQNWQLFDSEAPQQLIDQRHAIVTGQPFCSFNGSFQGLLHGGQNTSNLSMAPQSNPFASKGINQGHIFHPGNYSVAHSPHPIEVEKANLTTERHLACYRSQGPHYQQQQLQQLKQKPAQQLRQHSQQGSAIPDVFPSPSQHQHQHQPQQQQQPQSQQLQLQSQQLQLQQQQPQPQPQPQQQQQLPQHRPILNESPTLDKWHDVFLNAPKNQDISHIPWGQHALDRMLPSHPAPTRTQLPQNDPTWFFNA